MAHGGRGRHRKQGQPPQRLPAIRNSAKLTAQATAEGIFASFIANNPWSAIDVRKGQGEQFATIIRRPWGDENVITWCQPEQQQALADAINPLVLPPPLSAIWHTDSRSLEVIWTAKKLPTAWDELKRRSFTFDFLGNVHKCSFDKSSDRLLTLSKHTIASQDTATFGRNMQSFWLYNTIESKHHSTLGIGEPFSFWIENVDYDEARTIEMVDHISFYLTYFDAISPYIVVHTPPRTNDVTGVRYVRGDFPSHIAARQLDDSLISFWLAGKANNPMTAFLLYYRIIEYASGTFIDLETRSKIRRAILSPHLTSAVEECVNQILDAVPYLAKEDPNRIRRVIEGSVDPKAIWKDIKNNIAFFCEDTAFDGAFSIKPIASKHDTEEDFVKKGLAPLADALRSIRNAIAHGKDQETKGIVTPSKNNMQLLRPWISLITTAASDVILYKDT